MVRKGVLNRPALEKVTEASRKMLPVSRERTEAFVQNDVLSTVRTSRDNVRDKNDTVAVTTRQ